MPTQTWYRRYLPPDTQAGDQVVLTTGEVGQAPNLTVLTTAETGQPINLSVLTPAAS